MFSDESILICTSHDPSFSFRDAVPGKKFNVATRGNTLRYVLISTAVRGVATRCRFNALRVGNAR